MLVNTAALTKDVQDSVDDSYFDAKALLESATVATTQAAQTMETINKNAPVLTRSVTQISSNFAEATHSLDQRFFHAPPMNRKQKVASFFSNFESILIAALRGGVI